MTEYYDLILGIIPVSLIGITAALTVVGLSITIAVPIAAIVSVLVIGHAMFVNTPIAGEQRERTATASPPNAD